MLHVLTFNYWIQSKSIRGAGPGCDGAKTNVKQPPMAFEWPWFYFAFAKNSNKAWPTLQAVRFLQSGIRLHFRHRVSGNVLRVGDVALCCPACSGARQYCLHAVITCAFI